MTVKSLFLIMMGGILVNNYALEKLLGLTPFLGYTRRGGKAAGMGIAITVILLLAAAVTWPIQTYVLDRFALGYMQILVFVAVILALSYAVNAVLKKSDGLGLGVYFPVIVLNSAVLGLCLSNIGEGYGFVEALASALGCGLGFLLGMTVFAELREKIDDACVPKAFRGLPITVLAAFIFSMVLTAFK